MTELGWRTGRRACIITAHLTGTDQEGAIRQLIRQPAGIDRHPDTVQAGRATTAVRRNATEATRILASFAETAGWIEYREFPGGFCVHWTSVPNDVEAAAAQARAGLDDEGKHPDWWTTPPARSR